MQRLTQNRSGVSFLMLIALVFLPITSALAATLVSTVDRNKITLNDTVSLTLKLNQQANSNTLDLKPLEADFEVLGVSPLSGNSVTTVNGKTTKVVSTQWSITLAPKRAGTLIIPQFSIAGATSEPISIAVNASATDNDVASPLSVLLVADAMDVYPKQQVIVTVQLSAQSGVSNLNGSPLDVNNAEILELGQAASNRIDNGVATQVIELKYALFPKEPGVVEIPALTFTAMQGSRRSFLGSRGGKRIVARSKPLTIEVKTPPASQHTWLPSKQVELRSELSGDSSQYQVGAPITRKVIIKAQGLSAEAIPPISQNNNSTIGGDEVSTYKTYGDKPQLHTETSVEGLTGTRIESSAIVPSAPGKLTLPEIRLNWWNVAERRWQEAILPTETLIIAGASSTSNGPNPDNDQGQTEPPGETAADATNSVRLWQAASGLLLLICVVQLLLLIRKRGTQTPSHEEALHTESEGKAWQQLQLLLRQGDAGKIRRGILQWANVSNRSKSTTTLASLANHANSGALTAALNKLDAHLYGNDNKQKTIGEADLNALRESLTSVRENHKKSQKNRSQDGPAVLKPLYPE